MNTLRNKKHAPTHPGALLREVVLPELGITQGEFANQLGVSRRTVSEILHERRPVTPDMAIRLGKLLGNGAGIWLRMQQAVDVWTLEHWNKRATTATFDNSRSHKTTLLPHSMLIRSRPLARMFQLAVVAGGIAVFVLFGVLSGVSSQGDSSQTYPKGFRGGSCTLESDSLTIGYSGYFLPHDYEIPKDPMSTPFVPTLCGKIPSPGTLNITIDLLYPKSARDVPLALRLTRIGDNATEHELLSVPPQVYPSGVITQAFKLDAAGQYALDLDGRNAENPNLLIRVPIKVGTDWKDTFSNLLPAPKVHHPAGIHYSH